MRLSISALRILCVLACTSAAHASSTPARLTLGEDSIEELIRVPDGLALGQYKIFCEAIIAATGATQGFYCYSAAGTPVTLVNAAVRAGEKASFIPATLDGQKQAVYMLMMVVVQITNSEPLVLVVPNNGVDAERYGLFYTAPQRLNSFRWRTSKVVPSQREDARVSMTMRIDEKGNVTERAAVNVSGADPLLLSVVDDRMSTLQFIPGYFNRKPAPMLHVEMMHFLGHQDARSVTTERRTR
ncbi:MAG: hypothetical protein SXG53_05950 [Pseudomonadota bacterium]|nr:hypothetical protein [Pseudomonadota bacterium]